MLIWVNKDIKQNLEASLSSYAQNLIWIPLAEFAEDVKVQMFYNIIIYRALHTNGSQTSALLKSFHLLARCKMLSLKTPITTKVICFHRLLKR